MHPIHYSLILNLVAMIVAGLLAWKFEQPLLIVVIILIAHHELAKFQEPPRQELDDMLDEREPAIGFTADLR